MSEPILSDEIRTDLLRSSWVVETARAEVYGSWAGEAPRFEAAQSRAVRRGRDRRGLATFSPSKTGLRAGRSTRRLDAIGGRGVGRAFCGALHRAPGRLGGGPYRSLSRRRGTGVANPGRRGPERGRVPTCPPPRPRVRAPPGGTRTRWRGAAPRGGPLGSSPRFSLGGVKRSSRGGGHQLFGGRALHSIGRPLRKGRGFGAVGRAGGSGGA